MSTSETLPLPPEVLLHVLEHLPPSTILRTRLLSKAFNDLSISRSLWLSLRSRLPGPLPLPLTDAHVFSLAPDVLIKHVHAAHALAANWRSDLPAPRRTIKLKDLHADRITCLKLLQGGRWLFTGSVDGYVRCWDLATIRNVRGSAALYRGEIGKVAESSIGADISSLEVEMESSGEAAIVVVGSYYSIESCRVLRLPLPLPSHDYTFTRPSSPPKFHKASFFPLASISHTQWCGTQCVALEGEIVAVGGHLSPVQVLNWRTSGKGTISWPQGERRSIAAIKIVPPYIITITRMGQAELFRLPDSVLPQSGSRPSSPSAASDVPAGGQLISSHILPIAKSPLTSVSFSSRFLSPPARPGSHTSYLPISILIQQSQQSSLYALLPLMHPPPTHDFPYAFPPTQVSSLPQPATHTPEAARLGLSGLRAASTESIRDFLPFNRLLLWSPSLSSTISTTSSLSSSTVSSSSTPGPRAVKDDIRDPDSVWMWEEGRDLYTDVCLDEALGRVVVGTARGGVWVFDF